MRRKHGELVNLEKEMLKSAKDFKEQGIKEFYGLQIAKVVKHNSPNLTGNGTIYRALDRMVKMGLLKSRWEVKNDDNDHRPVRRYYSLVEVNN